MAVRFPLRDRRFFTWISNPSGPFFPACARGQGRNWILSIQLKRSSRVRVGEGQDSNLNSAIKRRKQIWEALHPAETTTSCRSLGGRGNTDFASETAAATAEAAGMTKQAIKILRMG